MALEDDPFRRYPFPHFFFFSPGVVNLSQEENPFPLPPLVASTFFYFFLTRTLRACSRTSEPFFS